MPGSKPVRCPGKKSDCGGSDVRSSDRIEIYKDKVGEWRWRALAGNGEVIANGGEGFSRKWSARRAARRAMKGTP
jgi:uncharacterized protein YegP (UPF0339 family)